MALKSKKKTMPGKKNLQEAYKKVLEKFFQNWDHLFGRECLRELNKLQKKVEF